MRAQGKKCKDILKVTRKMELDALNVLKFMVTNGLVDNPSKTSMVILNPKSKQGEEISIKITNAIIKQECTFMPMAWV